MPMIKVPEVVRVGSTCFSGWVQCCPLWDCWKNLWLNGLCAGGCGLAMERVSEAEESQLPWDIGVWLPFIQWGITPSVVFLCPPLSNLCPLCQPFVSHFILSNESNAEKSLSRISHIKGSNNLSLFSPLTFFSQPKKRKQALKVREGKKNCSQVISSWEVEQLRPRIKMYTQQYGPFLQIN